MFKANHTATIPAVKIFEDISNLYQSSDYTDAKFSGHSIVTYTSENGNNVGINFEHGTFWATEKQIAEIFDITIDIVASHINKIYQEGELSRDETTRILAFSNNEMGYNLNTIISVGYRIDAKRATSFRIWATDKIVKALSGLNNQAITNKLDKFNPKSKSFEASREKVVEQISQYKEALDDF